MTRVMAIAAAGVLLTSGLVAAAPGTATAATTLAPLIGPSTAAAASSASSTGEPRTVPDSYIVVLKKTKAKGTAAGRASAAASRGAKAGARVAHTYSGVVTGYSATMTAAELTAVRSDPAVEYVQRNLRYHLAASTQKQLRSWGLDRIDQRSLPLNGAYYLNATGHNVTAYVLDTGLQADHPDFANVAAGTDLVGSSGNGEVDCNGHGTHVSGTIGGTYFGVAKRVTLVPVRILDCRGEGDQDDILAGLDWVRQHHSTPAVANLSLETIDPDFDVTLNTAVKALIDDGVTVVAAAGNDSLDACQVSPASLPEAITVAASTITDRAAGFSNYGTCVDLYAPGEGITSDYPKDSSGTYRIATLDGTSMAAPHVTGAAALYLERNPTATPAQVSSWITSSASPNRIGGVSSQYPHDLLFTPLPVTPPAGVTTGDRLGPGQSLRRGVRLYSKGGAYFLAHRSGDGWLCLYATASGKVVWSSGHSAVWTNMNTSGSLSSYDSYGRRAWSTNTALGASTMIVNSKGYLMIKRNSDGRVLWTSPH